MTQPAGADATAHNAMVRIVETPPSDAVDPAGDPAEEVNTEKETAHGLE